MSVLLLSAASKAPVLCAGIPSAANVVFPTSCGNAKIGDVCSAACKAGVGIKQSVCGTDGKWGAPTGDCSTTGQYQWLHIAETFTSLGGFISVVYLDSM